MYSFDKVTSLYRNENSTLQGFNFLIKICHISWPAPYSFVHIQSCLKDNAPISFDRVDAEFEAIKADVVNASNMVDKTN